MERVIHCIFDRLYTTDKASAFSSSILRGTGIYKAILENNVDMEKSFNSHLMVENTISDPRSALFYNDAGMIQECRVNDFYLFE